METTLENYLERVERYLRPMPVSERVDIVKEIKSEMLELQGDGKSTQEILERMGDARALAQAYLGSLLKKSTSFSWGRLLTACAFYGAVGFSGMFVIPCLLIIAPCFIVLGIVAPVLGAVKMVDFLFHLGLPYMDHIGIVLTGVVELNPVGEFFVALIAGILLYLAGRGAWRLLLSYCRKVSDAKQALSV